MFDTIIFFFLTNEPFLSSNYEIDSTTFGSHFLFGNSTVYRLLCFSIFVFSHHFTICFPSDFYKVRRKLAEELDTKDGERAFAQLVAMQVKPF